MLRLIKPKEFQQQGSGIKRDKQTSRTEQSGHLIYDKMVLSTVGEGQPFQYMVLDQFWGKTKFGYYLTRTYC